MDSREVEEFNSTERRKESNEAGKHAMRRKLGGKRRSNSKERERGRVRIEEGGGEGGGGGQDGGEKFKKSRSIKG
jgi:hypothetical protein